MPTRRRRNNTFSNFCELFCFSSGIEEVPTDPHKKYKDRFRQKQQVKVKKEPAHPVESGIDLVLLLNYPNYPFM
jgi:hypothetical protein